MDVEDESNLEEGKLTEKKAGEERFCERCHLKESNQTSRS